MLLQKNNNAKPLHITHKVVDLADMYLCTLQHSMRLEATVTWRVCIWKLCHLRSSQTQHVTCPGLTPCTCSETQCMEIYPGQAWHWDWPLLQHGTGAPIRYASTHTHTYSKKWITRLPWFSQHNVKKLCIKDSVANVFCIRSFILLEYI